MRLPAFSFLLYRSPLLGLAVFLIFLLAASALLWTSASPASGQDGHQPDPKVVDDVWDYAKETDNGSDHVLRWMRVLHTFGELEDMTSAEAQRRGVRSQRYPDGGHQARRTGQLCGLCHRRRPGPVGDVGRPGRRRLLQAGLAAGRQRVDEAANATTVTTNSATITVSARYGRWVVRLEGC